MHPAPMALQQVGKSLWLPRMEGAHLWRTGGSYKWRQRQPKQSVHHPGCRATAVDPRQCELESKLKRPMVEPCSGMSAAETHCSSLGGHVSMTSLGRPLLLEPSAGLSGAITETGINDALFGPSNLGGENFFRQAYICWGRISWRRATTETLPSGPNASCNIDSFCSADHRRCRSAPVRISTLAIHTLLRHK